MQAEPILVTYSGLLMSIDNWKYSPYLRALVDSKNSDKHDDGYILDSLLDVADKNIIDSYMGYLVGGAISHDIDMGKFIKLAQFMGHEFSDIELLLGTVDDKKEMFITRVLGEKVICNMGSIINRTKTNITVFNKFWMRYDSDSVRYLIIHDTIDDMKQFVYNSKSSELTDKMFGYEGLYFSRRGVNMHESLGECDIRMIDDEYEVVSERTIQMIEKNGVIVGEDGHTYKIVNGELLSIVNNVEHLNKPTVLSYTVDGDTITVVTAEHDYPLILTNLYSDIYIGDDDVVYRIRYHNSNSIAEYYSARVGMASTEQYKTYINNYIHTYLYDIWVRDNLIPLGLNKDPLYACVKITDVQDNDAITSIKKLLGDIDFVIAGGYALHIFDNSQEYSDIDLFFCGDNCDLLMDRLRQMNIKHTITGNSITIHKKDNTHPLQIILRRYSSPTEIIHGFDVDCSSMMIYRGGLYCTHRCNLSLLYQINMFNTKRMSQTYVKRLYKYSKRGFKVLFPDIRLVENMRDKYLPLLTKTITESTMDHNAVSMANRYGKLNNKDVWKLRFKKCGMEPSVLNMFKLAWLLQGGIVKLGKVNSSGLVLSLLDKLVISGITMRYVPDYSYSYNSTMNKVTKFTLNNIVWKEQDPMTQVTSTFNPEEFSSFRVFLNSNNFEELLANK